MADFVPTTPEELIDNAMSYEVDFPTKEWAYCQAIGNQTRLDEITAQYTAMEARRVQYQADLTAAGDSQPDIDAVLTSLTRQ